LYRGRTADLNRDRYRRELNLIPRARARAATTSKMILVLRRGAATSKAVIQRARRPEAATDRTLKITRGKRRIDGRAMDVR